MYIFIPVYIYIATLNVILDILVYIKWSYMKALYTGGIL